MNELRALRDMPISFPGLFGDWSWNPDAVAVHIGHGIDWYGIILAIGMLCGTYLAMKRAKYCGLTEDQVLDLVLWAVPCCIVGSRTYYVVFNLDAYRNASGALDWGRIIAVWDGGIAMYGTVIVGFAVAFLYARKQGIPFGALTDAVVPGLLLGQVIGRWANLVNREAFGAPTDLPWRMRLYVTSTQTVDVHPTFFYESLWNLIGLVLLVLIVSKGRRFDGECSWFYFLWYGLGRTCIEGLRTDSLYLFGWTFFGHPIRVSQALSVVLAAAAAAALFYELRIRKRTAAGLYANRSRNLPEERDAEVCAPGPDRPDGGAEASEKAPGETPEEASGEASEETSEDTSGDTSEEEAYGGTD